jgi:hypothetical protein
MVRKQRLVPIGAGFGLLLLTPTYFAIAQYGATARLHAQIGPLRDALDESIRTLRDRPLTCSPRENGRDLLTTPKYWAALNAVWSANTRMGGAAFRADVDDDLVWARDVRLPGTRPLERAYDLWFVLGDFLSLAHVHQRVCIGADYMDEEEIERETRRSQVVVDKVRTELQTFRPRVDATQEVLAGALPMLRVCAWALGIVEALGLTAFVLYVRQLLRDRKQRLINAPI